MALRRETPDIMADLLRNQPAAAIVEIPLDDIADNPFQPRQSYDQAALEELATSIQSNGLQQPPAGRRMADGRVQLVFGHRRRRAFDVLRAKDPAWSTMPVMIVDASDEDMAARAWTENEGRMDVIGRRLRRVGELLDKADGSGRPFPSTTSLRDAKRRRLHELLSGEPARPSGYIPPTVDPDAPGNIAGKLERIAGWIAEFKDPGDGLPTRESVAGNFDNLDKLAKRLAGQASVADRESLQAMHAAIYADLAALSDRVQASNDEETNHA